MERVKSPPLISLGKMDIPGLEDPENLDMVTFSDWKARWNDYVTMTRVYQEVPDVAGRQAVLSFRFVQRVVHALVSSSGPGANSEKAPRSCPSVHPL